MNENEMLDVTKDVAKEVVKDIYNDIIRPIAKPTGEVLGLIPRAIKVAFIPLEQWISQKEYNIEKTKKLLEKKLENISPDLIESPEPHIAVPALQYISYCMDNEELRDMYANLLANSMNKFVKNGVHPGFVEIIKQLTPDEAKILRYINIHNTIPTLTLRYENDNGGGINIINNFSNIGEIAKCEHPYETAKYFDNLARLGLIIDHNGLSTLTDKSKYELLKNHKMILSKATNELAIANGYKKFTFSESMINISAFGMSFCSICLGTKKIIIQVEEGDTK